MHQVELYGITSVELQKRIGIWDLDYYVGRRTLQWVGHVVRMDKSRLPRRLLTAWVREPRPEFAVGGVPSGGDLHPTDKSIWPRATCSPFYHNAELCALCFFLLLVLWVAYALARSAPTNSFKHL